MQVVYFSKVHRRANASVLPHAVSVECNRPCYGCRDVQGKSLTVVAKGQKSRPPRPDEGHDAGGHGSFQSCFRPVSNRGPFACEANVITTTLRKQLLMPLGPLPFLFFPLEETENQNPGLHVEKMLTEEALHWPGIEPGPPAWQARILPLNHQCMCIASLGCHLRSN